MKAERASTSGDHLRILAGASQNLVGLVVAALATFGAQVLITRALGPEGFGTVTVLTQAAFVLSFATRAGMDMAVLRDVAIEAGRGRLAFVRSAVARAVTIAGAVSLLGAVLVLLAADAVRHAFSLDPQSSRWAVEAAAVGLPWLAVTNVWLAATRGLKLMRYTLYIFWAGQPLGWIVLMLAGWTFSASAWMSVLTYSVSWMVAAGAAFASWRRQSGAWQREPLEPGAVGRLWRYAAPRAPAALFSQLLFWTDLFVLTRYATGAEVGVYSAVLRAAQALVLFLTSVSLMFSPFIADLHARGERERLDRLYKALTRWTLAATLPIFCLFAVAPAAVLGIFGEAFAGGRAALMVLLAGQLVNIATGSAGFALIMVGRTGWDLIVIAGALLLDLALAFWLCPRYGMVGAATANAAAFAAANITRIVLIKRFIGIQPYDRNYGRLVVPTLACLGVMIVTHALASSAWQVDLLLTASLGALAYAGAYLVTGLTPAERQAAKALIASGRHGTP
jgi:O-antigen/teichoic acid export membrane protein